MTTWGLSATIKAPTEDILRFAAHHIELGAHRLYIYLDAPNPEAQAALKAHPKVRVTTCDAAHWARLGGKRPVKHQVRQTRNATHAYARKAEVAWLIHMDVDEFLWPDTGMASALAALPDDTFCARVRPIEALSGAGGAFKGFIPPGPDRAGIVAGLYPTFGRYLKGGFLSHVAGKLFVRTGCEGLAVRIHNVFDGDDMNPAEQELDQVALCHLHARDWADWAGHFRYRLDKGSYRADLAAAPQADMTLNDLFHALEAEGGEDALRQFFEEVSADTPGLRRRLQEAGYLRLIDLQLDQSRAAQFPTPA